MKKSILLPMTYNAIRIAGDRHPWNLFPRTRRISVLAKYYRELGMELKWNVKERRIEVDSIR